MERPFAAPSTPSGSSRRCHALSAWATEQSVVLAQRAVDADSNEITAIPDVLGMLELDGALVTLDARAEGHARGMGTQKEIAQKIRDRKSDYLLVLKGNHGDAYEAVASYFDTYCFGRGALQRGARSRLVFDAFDESHGRLARRRVFACAQAAHLAPLSEWPGLRCVLAAWEYPIPQ